MNAPPPAGRRTFVHRRILQITTAAFTDGVQLLATAASTRLGPVSAVIGVARGGLSPAAALAKRLEVPAYRANVRHNRTDDIYTPATGRVTCDIGPLAAALGGRLLGGNVLLIDDIYGTGATITALRPALTPYLEPTAMIHTVVLCRNAGATTDPDLWLWTVDDWVHFPWESAPPAKLPVERLAVPQTVRPT